MAETAFQTQYRQEFIAGFERGYSRLRTTCTTEMVRQGDKAIFLVADSGSATAVTRSVQGLIPGRADNLTQNTAQLVEWHDKPRRTRFNIFGSQGDGRRIMQEMTIKVMNRRIDDDILVELKTGTITTGSAQIATLNLVTIAKTKLGNAKVDLEDIESMFAVISPAFDGYLMNIPAYASADYVESKPFVGPTRAMKRWYGVNWICHSGVEGLATSSESCFMYHRDAIGHAADVEALASIPGYNEEEDYYWARTSIFMGSKLLQNAGVVEMVHDGSALA